MPSSASERLALQRLLWRVAAAVLGWACLACQVMAASTDAPVEITQAERQIDSGPWQRVHLPNWPLDPPIEPQPGLIRYRIALPDAPDRDPGLLMQGLLANADVRFNGHLVRAKVDPAGKTLPRGLDRIVVLSLPAGWWKRSGNLIEIEALAQNRMSVSRLELGDLRSLSAKHRTLTLTHYVGPLVTGGVVGTLGLAMLGLWVRLRDAPFALFAAGALAWWLVNWMPLFPWPPIGGVSYAISWISLFGVVVASFAAFCLRMSDWYRPKLEVGLLALAVAGPFLLGGAYAIDQMDLASSAWRLLLIGGTATALAAVCNAYWRSRSKVSLAMVVCGGIALVLGAMDWFADLDETLNNPVSLTTYAGLVFAATAAALLVERYVEASQASAVLRRELESRVSAQGVQLRGALAEMQLARDTARAADQAKSSFLAVASHDLRQPAHAIGLYLEAMPRQGMDPEQADVMLRLKDSHQALERMFDALLDMSQIDAGTVTPQSRLVSPWLLLQSLADEAAPAAEGKGLRLGLRAGVGAGEAVVLTDALLMERMLRNLITNALKYTQAGGILLTCRVRGGGESKQLRIEVWDSGVGIPPEYQERVFEEFFRINQTGAAKEGLGLGLPIVRRLARLLGVQLTLRSRPGHGSCFALQMPMASEPLLRRESGPVLEGPALQGARVGVLEDDPAVRDAMTRALFSWRCRVFAAESAAELAQVAGAERATLDLLIVDYTLAEGKTGPREAQAYLAATGARASVLVVTGEQTPARLRDLEALGLPWLPKPVSAETLRLEMARLLAQRQVTSGEPRG